MANWSGAYRIGQKGKFVYLPYKAQLTKCTNGVARHYDVKEKKSTVKDLGIEALLKGLGLA